MKLGPSLDENFEIHMLFLYLCAIYFPSLMSSVVIFSNFAVILLNNVLRILNFAWN